MKAVEDVLKSLKVKSGLQGEWKSIGEPWKVGLHYDRDEKGFVFTIKYKNREGRLLLAKDEISTKGKSMWMADNTWRLTEKGIERLLVNIEKSRQSVEARAARGNPL
jgi:hypothetical protein